MAEGLAVLPSAFIPIDCAEATKEVKMANNTSIVLIIEFFYIFNGLKIKVINAINP
jgi:hypothetical protein